MYLRWMQEKVHGKNLKKIDPKIPDTPKNEDDESTDDENPAETPSEQPTGKKDTTNPS